MTEFLRPPELSRHRIYGVSAEGFATSESDRVTFEHAVASFGFLVGIGERITGAQWHQRISRQYDVAQPRYAEVLGAISRVMLMERFDDDQLVLHDGVPVFRGDSRQAATFVQEAQAKAGAHSIRPVALSSGEELAAAIFAMATRDAARLGATLTGLPAGEKPALNPYGLACKLTPGASDDLMSRMIRLLNHSPVGPETFASDEECDFEAQCELAARLCEFLGYSAIVTAKPDDYQARNSLLQERSGRFSAEDIAEVLGDFASAVVKGAIPEKPFFLCRPMPLVGATLGIQAPFESVVHTQLCGFRLPSAMVESAIAQHRARQVEPERMRS